VVVDGVRLKRPSGSTLVTPPVVAGSARPVL
jgi:hypothetical protein